MDNHVCPRCASKLTSGSLYFVPRSRTSDPVSSQEAGESMIGTAQTQRDRIEEFLKVNPPMTADQVDERLGLRATSAGRRLPELRELGKAQVLEGEFRRTRSGRRAVLWTATI
jgi:predicted HTH transcriptional regulator